MTGVTTFFALLGGCAVVGIAVEYTWSRRHGLGWHDPTDTLGNLNLAAGQLLLGACATAIALGGYHALYQVRPMDLSILAPRPVWLLSGFLLAELLQYWNHRLSHAWNPMVWGHQTHHSSSWMNLSTGVRINWFYRTYAWVFYAPMAWVGFTVGEFVLFQAVMNVYNLFMHTRFDVPYGPLAGVLVSPAAHRLHHAADEQAFGNYGASLVIWDRLFGTWRDPAVVVPRAWGSSRNTDRVDVARLNVHHLRDLWNDSGRRFTAFFMTFLGSTPVRPGARHLEAPRPTAGPSRGMMAAVLGVVVGAVVVNQMHRGLAPLVHAMAVAVGLTAVVAVGAGLDRARKPADEGRSA